MNITSVNVLLALAESHLSKAESAFDENKYGEAFGQAVSAERLVENAKRIFERLIEVEEEREIEVEIEEGVAKVKVEIAGTKMKYRLNTSDENEIVSDIASRTGLTTTEIKRIMKIEIEQERELKKPEIEEEKEVESVEREFEITASSFKFEPSTITVNKGEKVELKITNTGGIHNFVIDEYGISKNLLSGRTTSIEFTADKSGTFAFYCSIGIHRSLGMEGQIVVE